MNKENKQEANTQSESLADLPVTDEQADQTKAGDTAGTLLSQPAGKGKRVTIDF